MKKYIFSCLSLLCPFITGLAFVITLTSLTVHADIPTAETIASFLDGRTLCHVPVAAFDLPAISDKIEEYGPKSYSDGMSFDSNGYLYVTLNQLDRSAALSNGTETGEASFKLVRIKGLAPSSVGR